MGDPSGRHPTSNSFYAKTLVRLGDEVVVNGEWYIPLSCGAVSGYAYA